MAGTPTLTYQGVINVQLTGTPGRMSWYPSPSSFYQDAEQKAPYSLNRRHALAAGELFPQALIIKKVGITNVW